jgi:uncharacterized membrane protein
MLLAFPMAYTWRRTGDTPTLRGSEGCVVLPATLLGMNTRLVNARDVLGTQLWPIPTLAVVTALLLGFGVPELDAVVDGDLSSRWSGWLFGGDADAARSLLGVIASSLITVTALTFSLTVVTLQLASSQFSPRLLRTFTRDHFVQVTLALFLSTFTYALTVLRAVRSGGDSGQAEFVPKIAVTLAFVLAVVSVLGLVLFLAHLTEQIRVETMLRNVHRDASSTMRTVLPEREPSADPRLVQPPPQPPPGALALLGKDDGFLTWINRDALLDLAVREHAVLRLDVYPGSFLVCGTPMGTAWPVAGEGFDDDAAQRIAEGVAGCVHVGLERTSAQDVGYGLRQLTDVANKALSPGINDPTTAIHALGHISAFLCALTDRDLGDELSCDEDNRIRVVARRPDFATYVDLGISQPRRYGATDPQVLEKIFQVLLDLSHRVRPDQVSVVRDQLERLRATAAAQSFDSAERAGLEVLGGRVEQNLRASGHTDFVHH